mmetsp:Transcript_142595/g.273910  ORF Transcript_142595/g.273910 Transcript_142595/m.273910 type:complete len:311 (-) Transcript_142595:62-994(-)
MIIGRQQHRSMMRRIAVFLASGACISKARRVQAPFEVAESSLGSNRRGGAEGTLNPLQAFSLFFLAAHPVAAYSTSSGAALRPSGTPALADLRISAPTMSTDHEMLLTRADLLKALGVLPALPILSSAAFAEEPRIAYQPSLAGKGYGKTEMDDPDFVKLPTGLRYKDAKKGTGKMPEEGDRVVLDWSGYTIGYFGRPFETKKLREIDKVEDPFLRFVIGGGTIIPAFEQGVLGMMEGGVRQLVVPGGPEGQNIGYPVSDPSHDKVGPKPSTFSGYQALNFVLQNNGLIDKTLLFNIKLIRVDKKGTFNR